MAREVKKELGGRVRWMASGGGYLDPVARNFLEVVFACPIIPVYGMTENTAVNFSMKSYDPEPGHIGGPGPNT